MKKILLITLSTLSLGSCALFSDPKPTKISGIQDDVTMNQINDKANSGEIDVENSPYLGDGGLGGTDGDPTNSAKSNQKLPPQIYGIMKDGVGGYQVATPSAGQPVRYTETLQKIYIFPYEDTQGNYYDTSIMYSVLDKSHWIGYPTQAIADEQYDSYADDED